MVVFVLAAVAGDGCDSKGVSASSTSKKQPFHDITAAPAPAPAPTPAPASAAAVAVASPTTTAVGDAKD